MPAGWARTRASVLRKSNICYICGTVGADQVDHILPRHRGGDDSVSNLRPVHRACHARKSSAEGNARAGELRNLRRRPEGRHPGAL